MSDFTPTDEQAIALGHFLGRRPLVVEAGAGTGKTSTLRLMAEADTRRGTYVAFNRAIVNEAAAKMPDRVRCATAHSLAFRAKGRAYSDRLNASRRMRSAEVARALRITDPLKVTMGQAAKFLAPGFLAGHAMRAIGNFCNSADPEPTRRHVPKIEGIDPADAGYGPNNRMVAEALEPALARAWDDLASHTGTLRFTHDCYLKLWQLAGARIDGDYVLFDEAQDASPVMLDIVRQQADHAQLVYVGDTQQQIYGWRGAINALASLDGAERTLLTQSFRFGPAIAEVANEVLDRLGADLRLVGSPWLDSRIDPDLADPTAVLCRTNATTVRTLLAEQKNGGRPHLVGDGKEVVAFARAVIDLQTKGWTPHPELTCFGSWGEVQDYVDQDPSGGELRLLVKLVEEYTAEVIIEALGKPVPEAQATVVLSTAHKAKGREWATVRLADDYPEPSQGEELAAEELRLVYVAATRAMEALDPSGVAVLATEPEPPSLLRCGTCSHTPHTGAACDGAFDHDADRWATCPCTG